MHTVKITSGNQLEQIIKMYQGVLIIECYKHYSGPFFLMRPVLQQLTRMFDTELIHCRIDLGKNELLNQSLQITVELAYIIFHQRKCIAQIEGMVPLLDFMNTMEAYLFELQETEINK